MAANEVTVAATGFTSPIVLAPGIHYLEIVATDWDDSSVTLQESGSGVGWEDSDDPYNTGNALTRTANGKLIRVYGGVQFRLNCTTFGASTDSLKIISHLAGR